MKRFEISYPTQRNIDSKMYLHGSTAEEYKCFNGDLENPLDEINNSYAAEIQDNKNLENTEVFNRSPIVIFDLNDPNHIIETE